MWLLCLFVLLRCFPSPMFTALGWYCSAYTSDIGRSNWALAQACPMAFRCELVCRNDIWYFCGVHRKRTTDFFDARERRMLRVDPWLADCRCATFSVICFCYWFWRTMAAADHQLGQGFRLRFLCLRGKSCVWSMQLVGSSIIFVLRSLRGSDAVFLLASAHWE